MTPTKVLIEITSSEIKTVVLSSDGEPLGEYKWERTGAGSWRGHKKDWEAMLNEQAECDGDFDELSEALDDLSLTEIGYALGSINFEDF